MSRNRPQFGSHSDTSTIKNMVTDLFSQMRDPSPSAPSPHGSTSSLSSGVVTKNTSFLLQNSTEHLPWNSGANVTSSCNNNLTGEHPPLVRSVSNASNLTSLSADLSPSDSHFFEVLYIGKVRISQRKIPDSLIDDALHKFALHEAEKALKRRHSLLSSNGTSMDSTDSTDNITEDRKALNNNLDKKINSTSTTPLEPQKTVTWKSVETLVETNRVDDEFDEFTKERIKSIDLVLNAPKNNLGTVKEDEEKIEGTAAKVNEIVDKMNTDNTRPTKLFDAKDEVDNVQRLNFDEISRKPKVSFEKSHPENKPFLRDRSASIGTITNKTPISDLIGEQNRTMLFQVGRSELRLISPDRKQILLHRAFKDVSSCVLGRVHREHFGFVCRDLNDTYACYVFRCESDSVATELVSAIRQAFIAHADLLKKSRDKSPNMTCEHCPMLWYHRLCHDTEGMTDKRAHAFILRRMEQLPEDEQEVIIMKYQGGTNHMYETSEHNSFLMMLLRAHCEAKQQRHVHDTAENRSEFLNQYLGGSTIFMKAKRSLSSGFDHLLKRRASKDDGITLKKETSPLPTPGSEHPPDLRETDPSIQSTVSGYDSPSNKASPSLEDKSEIDGVKEDGTVTSPMMDIFMKVSDSRSPRTDGATEPDSTWRQAIYEKVVQPTDRQEDIPKNILGDVNKSLKRKRTKHELRQLWKMAIDQTILLVRMENENARLKESEESSAVRRIKLEYTELGVCDAGVSLMWDSLLSRDVSQPMAKVDKHMLTQAVIQGVPRMSRGAVWYFLAEQAALRSPPPDTRAAPLYHAPYKSLLAGLTKHQHAILIDLGRTFPKHSYFASALGPGQLALYNILKAYSLLDPDVGYCQGLSFVAGVLLLHMEEAEAFVLLRHLMFRRGLRKQYLPDMSALQVQLYQLSRLLKDHEPELHAKLESLDISPALYAAPWMLTLFTSQFPLGLVVRVFDLIFLESLDIVFAVSLSLLSVHKDGVMLCESCEEAAEYLKHKLPDMDRTMYEKVMKKVLTLDLGKQLNEYAVEYAVLREEMPRLSSLTEHNKRLTIDNNKMSEQLDSAMDAITNYQKNQSRLESNNKIMEQHLMLLSRFISSQRTELPAEIKKIVQTHSKRLSFSSKIFSSKSEEDERKPYKGLSTPNLFAKMNKEEVTKQSSPEVDRRPFPMKKSQSVHSGLVPKLKVLDERDENKRNESVSDSLKELGRKNSDFFGSLNEQINQERMFEQRLKKDFDENLKKFDENFTPKSYIDDLSLFQSRKTLSLNFETKLKVDKVQIVDSGFPTPLSPITPNDRTDSIISHPLSDCDVDIKFDGQSTKLKQIRPIKHTNTANVS